MSECSGLRSPIAVGMDNYLFSRLICPVLIVVIQLDGESSESLSKWKSELNVTERNWSEIPGKK